MAKEILKSITTCMMETVRVLEDVAGMQNLERTLHTVVKKLTENLNCQTCAVINLNPKTEKLEILNSHGLSWQFYKEYRQKTVSQPLRELIWREKPTLLRTQEDNITLAEALKLEHNFNSCYIVNLTAVHRPLGFIYVDSKDENAFSPDDQLITQLYAKVISLAILKDNLLRDLQNQAIKDPYTGAVNYTIFYALLQESIARAQRLDENLSLILLDVVKFDTLLTSYGDETCKQLMDALMSMVSQHIRNYDALSKFGTDEIIISLPGHTNDEAYACTKKLYKKISESLFTLHNLKIDVSMGIANFPENSKSLNGLLTATKNALLESKRNPDLKIIKSDKYFD